jgi:hypothetical protein
MKLVLAFDPGVDTGFAMFLGEELLQHATFGTGGDNDERSQYAAIADVMQKGETIGNTMVVVVCERFTTFAPGVGAKKSGTDTAHLCGWIKGLALQHQYRLQWQSPAARKPYESFARDMPHNTRHEVSAMAHALAFIHKPSAKSTNSKTPAAERTDV